VLLIWYFDSVVSLSGVVVTDTSTDQLTQANSEEF